MQRISDAILDKVKVEAQDIVKEAETRARERIERAKEQQEVKLKKEENKLLEEATEEAARILSQSAVTARQEVLFAKSSVIDEMISQVQKTLSAISVDESFSLNLIKEAIDVLNTDKVRIYVSPKDVSAVEKLVAKDKILTQKIGEIREADCSGGVIIEDTEGTIRIDNTYDTRLEMLLPRLLPEIGKELFQDS